MGFGFEWDGHWFHWNPPEVPPFVQSLLVLVGGCLLLYGLAPSLLRRRLVATRRGAAVPARFQHGLLLGGAILSFVQLVRGDEDFMVISEAWLILAFLVALSRLSLGARGARQAGVAQLLAFLLIVGMSTVCALPGDSLANGLVLSLPVGLLALAVVLRRRVRPPAHQANADAAWCSLGMVPSVMLLVALAAEWFPYDPHHNGAFLIFLLATPLWIGLWFAMLILALAEPVLVGERARREPPSEVEGA